MAHNRKQVKPKEILKNSSAFQHVMNLSNKVAAEGGRKNLGVRAEYRLTPQSDDELMDFMDDLVEQVFQHKAISKLNSAVVFALKRERNRAVAYMAKRLKEVCWGRNVLHMYVDVATYVRYIFLGTLSCPDNYSGTRRLVLDHEIRTNMKHLGLPIADWLSVRYLYLNPTSPYAALPQLPPPDSEAESGEVMDADSMWVEIMPHRL
ncbi:hypothetical protein GGH14_002463 [Coemansia sp. RSA 370]|nr:hypothetical protein GGH14_002463 [Coemansia sp. RSA 370]